VTITDAPTTSTTGTYSRTTAVDLCLDLTTILACNAYQQIENNDHAFDFVTGATQHTGARTRVIDAANEALADRWLNLERVQRSSPEGLYMHSEEATRPWSGTAMERPWLLQVDEFDGTTIASGSTANWSVSALAFVWSHRRQRYSLAGGAIACHDGHVITYINTTKQVGGISHDITGDVWFRRFDLFSERDLNSLTPVALGPAHYVEGIAAGSADMVAISAAVGDRGSVLASTYATLLTGTRYRTVCAGTPIVYGAIRGQIGMIIDPSPATLHDANHLFPLACLGYEIREAADLTRINILDIAEANCEPGSTKTPIPATVAARNSASLELLTVQMTNG
jgi:hypothetical protein